MGTAASEPKLAVDDDGRIHGFASTKREILLMLKRRGEADLETLSRELHVSKTAAHKHVKDLEAAGLVERTMKRLGVGRPRLALRLAPGASTVFPKAYASLTCSVLRFLEEKLGREAVEEALRRRTASVLPEYERRVTGDFEQRVRALAKLRDEEGYMADVRQAAGGSLELFEYNCPILAVADTYGEACDVENEMFQRVLRADVETTHRVVAGDHVCRFLIRPRPEGQSHATRLPILARVRGTGESG